MQTPMTMLVTRTLFAGYFTYAFFAVRYPPTSYSTLSYPWLVYLGILYMAAERARTFFQTRNIDLTYAFPLLFANYLLNAMTEILGGQDHLPLLNRAEHLMVHIFLGYIVWIFFTQYLPHTVWQKHPYYTAILVISVTSTFGVINEVVELMLDSLLGTTLIGDRLDTPLDLLMNTLGAGLFLAVRLIMGETEEKSAT